MIDCVQQKGESIKSAGAKFGVPRITLQNKLKKIILFRLNQKVSYEINCICFYILLVVIKNIFKHLSGFKKLYTYEQETALYDL